MTALLLCTHHTKNTATEGESHRYTSMQRGEPDQFSGHHLPPTPPSPIPVRQVGFNFRVPYLSHRFNERLEVGKGPGTVVREDHLPRWVGRLQLPGTSRWVEEGRGQPPTPS